MNKQHLSITPVDTPNLSKIVASLSHMGKLEVTDIGLVYLNIDDNYIHHLFALLPDNQAIKPDYFGPNLIGAHISVFYPEENIHCINDDLHQIHHFNVLNLFTANLDSKKYYALKVFSPSLLALRRRYGLTDKLSFKNHWIDFHITVGVNVNPLER